MDVKDASRIGQRTVRSRRTGEAPEVPRGFGDVARRRKWKLALSAGLATLSAALGLVPYVLVYLISVHLFSRLPAEANASYVWLLAGLSVAAIGLKALAFGLAERVSHVAAYDILYELRMELARKLSELPLGYFSDKTTGELKKVLHEDTEQIEEGLAHAIPDITSAIATPLLTAIVLFYVDWRMALATVAMMPLLVGLYGYILGRAKGHMSAYGRMMANLNSVVVQYVQGMRVIKAFTRTDSSFAEYRKAVEEASRIYEEAHTITRAPFAVFYAGLRANVLVILPVGVALYLTGTLSLPTLVLFLLLGMGFNQPLFKLMMTAGMTWWKISGSTKKIAEVLAEDPLPEPANPKVPEDHDLEFKNVSFAYGEKRVLTDVSFRAPEGTVTALVGPSGAGKTTVARLIPRFWDVSGGEVLLGGVDVREMASEDLMQRVAFVFQDVFLFDDTVYENIRVGRPGATEEEVLDAARRARVDEFVRELPDGYGTRVGENGAKLSGGQRQRVSIARAILKDAPLVVLDEATAFVDPENEAQIQEALGSLIEEKTLVVVAHRLSTITGADRILVVEDGRISARGTHEELLEGSETYRTLWEAHEEAQERATADVRAARDGVPKVGTYVERKPAEPPENPYAGLEGESFVRMVLRLAGRRRRDYVRRALPLQFLEGVVFSAPVVFVFLTLLELFRDEVSLGRVYLYVGGILLSFALLAFFNYLATGVLYRVDGGTKNDLRLYIGEHLRRLPLGYFTRRDTGRINALVTNDIMQLDYVTSTAQFVRAVVSPALTFVVLLLIDWRMALAAFAGIPLFLLVLWWGDGVFEKVWREQTAARTEANSRMIEYIRGIPVVRAFNLGGERSERFEKAMDRYRRASANTQVKVTPVIVGGITVLELGFAAILVVGSALFLAGALDLSVFLLFLVLGTVFYAPIYDAGELMGYRRMVQKSMRKVTELLDTRLLPEPKTDSSPQDHSIQFEGVSFGYEKERVLKDVSFEIPERSMTALVGPSGSGKTTITYLIARFWDVDEGAVRVGDVDVRDMKTDTLMSNITMVFQDVYLFNDTVANNIRFGNPNATEREVVAAAKAARCHEFIMRLPRGYDTMVGEGGSTLSGGEKQRISIARALLKDAPIVLLDEATASIDPENERLIQDALNALVAEKTLVVIAHRLSTVRSADNIICLKNGRVIQQGTHDDLISQDGLYRRFWAERARARDWKLGLRDLSRAPANGGAR